MSDQTIVELLERAASRVPASEPPVAELLRAGQRGRRRRRVTALVGSAAAVLVVAGGVALATASDRGGTSPVAAGIAPPPPGTKWVGIGRTVVAVPSSWSMWPGLYCPSLDGHDHVTIVVTGITASCAAAPVGVPMSDLIVLRDQGGGLVVEVDRVRPGSGVTQQSIDRSRTTLPKGWLAVPAAASLTGTDTAKADDEARALVAAGFEVSRATEPSWNDGPTVRTDPAIGTPARLGSTVVVYERRPAPAVASLRGRLMWVGGPAPGLAKPHAGTVHVVGDGMDWYVPVGPDGRWSFEGPAGTFTVTGSSPGYLSAAGVPDSCHAATRVTLRWEHTTKADVTCQLK